ncbi:MAG: cyclic nucleotide-binding domain-containing protein [Magnetococcales bacterium]|nr:cyclic nucleotide-binding domain-containing protein [Magnetococcales bacterium]
MVILELLEQIPFFWDMTEEEKKLILKDDSFFSVYQPGDYIIKEGPEETYPLYVMVTGDVKVTKNCAEGEKELIQLTAGAVIGEMSFLVSRPRATNVIAINQVTVFRIDDKTLVKMPCDTQIKIKDKLIEILIKRLDDMNTNQARADMANQVLTKALREAQSGP